MIVQTDKFIYTVSEHAPYKVMKFNLSGVFVESIGEVSKPSENLVLALAEKHENFLSEAKARLSILNVPKKPKATRKKI